MENWKCFWMIFLKKKVGKYKKKTWMKPVFSLPPPPVVVVYVYIKCAYEHKYSRHHLFIIEWCVCLLLSFVVALVCLVWKTCFSPGHKTLRMAQPVHTRGSISFHPLAVWVGGLISTVIFRISRVSSQKKKKQEKKKWERRAASSHV